jgi:uncharacterized protein involved in response to NO
VASIPRLRAYQGPAILSYGFRPFFLAGAIYSGLAMLIWLPIFFGDLAIPTAFSPIDWHVHEMVYGYLPAILTGFLLTAIPNWTGRLPLQGGALVVLVLAWLAGRVAIMVSALIGPVIAGGIDSLFLALFAAATAREVIAGRNWRNLPPVGILSAFVAGNVIFHVEAYANGSAEFGKRIGIAAAVGLVTLIGGRVIPSFTQNWLARENPGRLPVPFARFDVGVMILSGLALVVWVAAPEWPAGAALLLIAGLANAVRLGRWAGDRTFRNPSLLILHLAYAFVPLGFLFLGGAVVLPQSIPVSGGIHAWTVGAIGVMTLAMMTRVSLGHTGRPLSAHAMTLVIYAAVLIAALARVCAAFEPGWSAVLLPIAAAAWVVAFGLFGICYGPMLCRGRVTAR